jgi:hypothetical protein
MKLKTTILCLLFFMFGVLSFNTNLVPNSKLSYFQIPLKLAQNQSLLSGCSAKLYLLTPWSIWLANNDEGALMDSKFKKGKGSAKIPTWGCGLAFYDHGGGEGKISNLYYWGEGLPRDETRFIRHEGNPTGLEKWQVIYPAYGMILFVQNAS